MANGSGTIVIQNATQTIQVNNMLRGEDSIETRLALIDRVLPRIGARTIGDDILDVLLAGAPFGIFFAVVWFGKTPKIVLDLLRKCTSSILPFLQSFSLLPC